MNQRIIPFHDMERALNYARYVLSLSGAKTLAVLPNGIVVQYNETIIFAVARTEGSP